MAKLNARASSRRSLAVLAFCLLTWRISLAEASPPFFAFCMDTHDSQKRTLEEQASLLKDLNEVIYEQHQKIERLEAICDILVKRVKELSAATLGNDAPADEKPPHY